MSNHAKPVQKPKQIISNNLQQSSASKSYKIATKSIDVKNTLSILPSHGNHNNIKISDYISKKLGENKNKLLTLLSPSAKTKDSLTRFSEDERSKKRHITPNNLLSKEKSMFSRNINISHNNFINTSSNEVAFSHHKQRSEALDTNSSQGFKIRMKNPVKEISFNSKNPFI